MILAEIRLLLMKEQTNMHQLLLERGVEEQEGARGRGKGGGSYYHKLLLLLFFC